MPPSAPAPAFAEPKRVKSEGGPSELGLPSASTAIPPGLQPPRLAPSPAQRPEEVTWQYRDPSGIIQGGLPLRAFPLERRLKLSTGPFVASQMHDWFLHQFFTGDLLIKPHYQSHFESLDSWIARVGPNNRDKPFLSLAMPSAPPPLGQRNVSGQLNGFPPQSLQPVGVPSSAPLQPHAPISRQFTTNYDPFQAGSAAPQPSYERVQPPQQPAAQQTLDPWGIPIQTKPSPSYSFHDLAPSQGPPPDPFQHQQQPYQPGVIGGAVRSESPLNSLHASSVPVPREAPSPWQTFPRESMDDKSGAGAIGSHFSQPSLFQALGKSMPHSLSTSTFDQTHSPAESLLASLNASPDTDSGPFPPAQPFKEAPVQKETLIEQARPAPVQPIEKPATPIKPPKASVPPPVQAPAQESMKKPTPAKQAPAKELKQTDGAVHITPSKMVVTPAGTPSKSATKEKEVQPTVESTDTSSPLAALKAAAPWSGKEAASPAAPAQPSLRDIQAREAKDDQLRKAAERKVKAAALAAEQAALAARSSQEAELTQAMQWAKTNGSSDSTSTAAVWQASSAPAKKTLKEIQEEEAKQQQRRAQAQKQAQAQAQAQANGTPVAGRGYASKAGATSGPSPSPVPAGPWVTVGSTGKAVGTPKPQPQPSPTPAQPRASSSSTVAAAKPATPVSVNVRPAAPVRRVATPSIEKEKVVQPTPEFMKWCRSALQGLTVPSEFCST
jgi:PERQ amino acid-rich with GYF domain-containing protein